MVWQRSGAFTLFEILVVVAIMASVVALILRFRVPDPSIERRSMVQAMNLLVTVARQEALLTKKRHRLLFVQRSGAPDYIAVEREDPDPENPKKKQFVHIEPFDLGHYVFPRPYNLHAVYVDGKELLRESKKGVSVFVIPDGILPAVVVHIRMQQEEHEERLSYELKPFLGTFKEHEGFIRPSRAVGI